MSLISSLLFSVVLSSVFVDAAPQEDGEFVGGLGDLAKGAGDGVGGVVDGVGGGLLPLLSSELEVATATRLSPSAVSDAASRISSVIESQATEATFVDVAINLVEAGLTTESVKDDVGFVDGLLDGENSSKNVNRVDPRPAAYPKAGPKDAPYSLSETTLRSAIYIPDTFQFGRNGAPQPIILVPGTGNTGYITFKGNYIPLLQGSMIGDPVWLNIPGFLLDDVQLNSEFVAYAINYIYGISNRRKPAVFSWSQGGLDAQWAFKYWPSTRARVTDLVAFSPDFHGTVLAGLLDVSQSLPPSILQQQYNSNFVATLRANGGDSSYVPTTTVYSGFVDQIVQPQSGRNASAFLLDAHGNGVTNNEVQRVCPPGTAGGSLYTHEGTLYNPLGFALAADALEHPGPGSPSRLNLPAVCAPYLTPGLDLTDFLFTENTILVAGAAIVAYPDKVLDEPAIKRYALRRN